MFLIIPRSNFSFIISNSYHLDRIPSDDRTLPCHCEETKQSPSIELCLYYIEPS
ncbi:hypothetical protein ACN4EE_02375 [Geminocystis sp. CENA526]|uniref:hypothetical protein n=1 Tax=Geminocystis sp. CENA526 TaxID=1355871 RepID=UPI003D6F1292